MVRSLLLFITQWFFFIRAAPSNGSSQSIARGQAPLERVLDGGQLPLVAGYYADWATDVLSPEDIDWVRYDWVDFAFALPTDQFSLTWDDPNAPALMARVVKLAHDLGKKVKLSIGGWTGSKNFSPAVATNETITDFIANIISAYSFYHLDGIDIDWEYPGRPGQEGNHYHPSDTANFLQFLKLLRVSLPPEAFITAAVSTAPFIDATGQPAMDLSEFAQVLNWVTLMNYDVWDSSPSPGPNAPMYDACGNSSQPGASLVGAFNAWTSASFPSSQLVLGLPAYGYKSHSKASGLRTRQENFGKTRRDSVLDGTDGQIQFNTLVQQGALEKDQNGKYIGGMTFERHWDQCSMTPFLDSPVLGIIVPYDDPDSLQLKATFVKSSGMCGVNLFDLSGDTREGDLITACRKGLGFTNL